MEKLTRVSKLFNRRLNSASSGEVIKIKLSFCTISLANSKSCPTCREIFHFVRHNYDRHTSSFSKISANVRYIRSVFKSMHSCRMIKLPREFNSLRSVLNNSRRLFINDLK